MYLYVRQPKLTRIIRNNATIEANGRLRRVDELDDRGDDVVGFEGTPQGVLSPLVAPVMSNLVPRCDVELCRCSPNSSPPRRGNRTDVAGQRLPHHVLADHSLCTATQQDSHKTVLYHSTFWVYVDQNLAIYSLRESWFTFDLLDVLCRSLLLGGLPA